MLMMNMGITLISINDFIPIFILLVLTKVLKSGTIKE